MKAVQYYSNDDVRVVEMPRPSAGPGELLVRVAACGVCASDVMEWYMRPRAPLFIGHEPVGTVSCGPRETRRTLELLAADALDADRLITHRFTLDHAAQALRITANPGQGLKALVVME